VVDLFDISDFAKDALQALLSGYDGVVTLEEGFRGRGGMDSMLFEFIARRGLRLRMLNLGVDGVYRFELGSRRELHELAGIGPDVVFREVSAFIQYVSV